MLLASVRELSVEIAWNMKASCDILSRRAEGKKESEPLFNFTRGEVGKAFERACDRLKIKDLVVIRSEGHICHREAARGLGP